jgi:hypothetical protein
MDELYKLMIAKLAFREIEEAIDKYEQDYNVKIKCHWDKKITVDGTEFYEFQLRKGE